jgi:hypothetical protein
MARTYEDHLNRWTGAGWPGHSPHRNRSLMFQAKFELVVGQLNVDEVRTLDSTSRVFLLLVRFLFLAIHAFDHPVHRAGGGE